jgi:hypothetical protein
VDQRIVTAPASQDRVDKWGNNSRFGARAI